MFIVTFSEKIEWLWGKKHQKCLLENYEVGNGNLHHKLNRGRAWSLNAERVIVEVVLSEQSQHAELWWVHGNKQLILWAVNAVKPCFFWTWVLFSYPPNRRTLPALLTLKVCMTFSSPQHYINLLLMSSKYQLGEGQHEVPLPPNKGHVLAGSLITTLTGPNAAGEHTLQFCLIKFPFLCRAGLQKSCRKFHCASIHISWSSQLGSKERKALLAHDSSHPKIHI